MKKSDEKVTDKTSNDKIKVAPFTFRIYLRDSLDDYIASLREGLHSLSLKEMLADEEE